MSQVSNDGGRSTANIEFKHTDVNEEQVLDETDTDESFHGFELEQNSDRQQPRVQIADADEFVKEETQFRDEYGNTIDEEDISAVELNQETSRGTLRMQDDEISHTSDEDEPAYTSNENKVPLEFKTNYQRIMFGNYYRFIEKKENSVTAECKSCELILKDSYTRCDKTRLHLKVCINFYIE